MCLFGPQTYNILLFKKERLLLILQECSLFVYACF